MPGPPPHCPICTIQSLITTIHQIQTLLTSRGGVFHSKHTALHSNPSTPPPNNVSIHYLARRDWTSTKASLANHITAYESRLAYLKTQAEKRPQLPFDEYREREDLEMALAIWEEEKDACARVPGVCMSKPSIWTTMFKKIAFEKVVRGVVTFFIRRRGSTTPSTPLPKPKLKPILRTPHSSSSSKKTPNQLTPLLIAGTPKQTRFSPVVDYAPSSSSGSQSARGRYNVRKAFALKEEVDGGKRKCLWSGGVLEVMCWGIGM